MKGIEGPLSLLSSSAAFRDAVVERVQRGRLVAMVLVELMGVMRTRREARMAAILESLLSAFFFLFLLGERVIVSTVVD